MNRLYGHTWLLLAVAALLTALAVGLIMFVPGQMEEREVHRLEERADILADVLAARFAEHSNPGFATESDSLSVVRAIELARSVRDLWYLVATDASGLTVAAINEPGARRVGFDRHPDSSRVTLDEGMTVKARHEIHYRSGMTGTLYIGFSKASLLEQVREYRRFFMVVGLVLIALSLFILLTVHKTNTVEQRVFWLRKKQRDLSAEKGSLESEVRVHMEAEAELREREERYRHLLEHAMESAFKDLESLNADLERQKHDLENEVAERTKAQSSLARHAELLRGLNALERLMLDEQPLAAIAGQALDTLCAHTKCSYASIVQFDRFNNRARVVSTLGAGSVYGEVDESLPMNLFSSERSAGEFRHVADLDALDVPSTIDQQLKQTGIRCYARILLSSGDGVGGILDIGMDKADALTDSDLKVLKDIADVVSIALKQAQHVIERERYETELITAKDRAEEMARLKAAFLANMSHEIRTPLSGIIGFSQVLKEEVPETAHEFTDLIEESARRLLGTINSVLDLSRLEASRDSLPVEPVNVLSAAQDAARLLSPLATAKELILRVETEPDTDPESLVAMANPGGLDRILNNLVGNAVKFTSSGSITLRVFAEDNQVFLEVTDTGVGISDEFMPHLFDEFRQEEMDSNRSHEGSGLGLAITNRLVERMSGSIHVQSVRGTGSTFTVSFVSALADDIVRAEAGSNAMRALVVSMNEDLDPCPAGYVTRAASLENAVGLCRRMKFDRVIVHTSSYNPDLGPERIRALRDIPGYGRTPFILLDENDHETRRDGYRDWGFDEYVVEQNSMIVTAPGTEWAM